MHHSDFTKTTTDARPCGWMLAYTTIDVPLESKLEAIMRSHSGVRVFGCTSFQGVFTPNGFTRGFHVLGVTKTDNVRAFPELRKAGGVRARAEARAAMAEIQAAAAGRMGRFETNSRAASFCMKRCYNPWADS